MKRTLPVTSFLVPMLAMSIFPLALPASLVIASTGDLTSAELQVNLRQDQSELERIPAGQEFQLEALVSRTSDADHPTEIDFVGILQIRDSQGKNADLLLSSSSLGGGEQSRLITFKWTPSVTGTFTYIFFLISPNEEAPGVLTTATSNELRIVDPANLIDPPAVDHGLTGDQIEELADYTLMVYMVGSDLETYGYYATEDIIEMMVAASPENGRNVNIVIQTGGAANATDDRYRFIDFTRVQTHKISGENIQLLRDLGALNMGDPDTLSGFLTYAATEFPAKKYAVVLWDDGSGANGFGSDSISHDYLTLNEINDAFSHARDTGGPEKFELVGFDACLMASIEVLSSLDEFGVAMVASEELEPGWGWDYSAVVRSLQDNPGQTGIELGKNIADSYIKHIDSKTKDFEEYNTQDALTISVIDLSKIPALESAVEGLSDTFYKEMDDQGAAKNFARAIGQTERFGIGSDFSSSHVDLFHLSSNIGQQFRTLQTPASDVMQLVDEAVVYRINGVLHQDSRGISMFMPETLEVSEMSTSSGLQKWERIITKYNSLLGTDVAAPVLDYEPEYYNSIIHGELTATDLDRVQIFIAKEVLEHTTFQIVAYFEQSADSLVNDDRFSYPVDKTIISLCNGQECRPAWMYSQSSGISKYAIFPVRLESSDFNGEVSLIYHMVDATTFRFIGAWPGIDEDGTASRELLPLEKGDKLYMIGYQIDIRTGEKYNRFIESDPIEVLGEGFGPAFHVYEGEYFISLGFCDFAQNCNYAPWFPFEAQDDEET